ncbi:MAG: hypothetical protein ACO1QB_16580 [Verrucomicrobiales bacterium]
MNTKIYSFCFAFAFLLQIARGGAYEPCRIEVVEKGTGWPVPLVELRSLHHQRFVSDNAGLIAMDSPELMGKEVWFDVVGHGYEVPKDGFGYRGVRLLPEAGKTIKVEVNRTIIARRLGRITGGGIFGEAQKLGLEKEWKESGVLGADSVQKAVFGGKLYWAWGDTTLPLYPLGVFDMSSATTSMQPLKSFEPPIRLQLDYFRDEKGHPRGVAKMPGSGPTWIWGYTTLKDKHGAERLVASYVKIKPPLDAYETGLCVWNPEEKNFEPLRVLWTKSDATPKQPIIPEGHPAFYTDSKGVEWVYFGNPIPTMKCKATFESWSDPAQWVSLKKQEYLESATGAEKVIPHTGSMAWSSFRKRWVTVFMEKFGKPSAFGELWYAEADAPEGPWGKAIKILSHDNYTFYNPRIHAELTPEGSPILIFEGTYTAEFADKPHPTPRYNYNQLLYRLDLDDPRLARAQNRGDK